MQASEAAEPLLRQLEEARRSGEAAAAKSGRVEAGLRKELEEARAELREAQKEARQQAGRAESAEGAASRAQESMDEAERQLKQLRTRSDQDARAAQASRGSCGMRTVGFMRQQRGWRTRCPAGSATCVTSSASWPG